MRLVFPVLSVISPLNNSRVKEKKLHLSKTTEGVDGVSESKRDQESGRKIRLEQQPHCSVPGPRWETKLKKRLGQTERGAGDQKLAEWWVENHKKRRVSSNCALRYRYMHKYKYKQFGKIKSKSHAFQTDHLKEFCLQLLPDSTPHLSEGSSTVTITTLTGEPRKQTKVSGALQSPSGGQYSNPPRK